jgi:tripartite-type tricarboxylate transporter receptor subunit TctC
LMKSSHRAIGIDLVTEDLRDWGDSMQFTRWKSGMASLVMVPALAPAVAQEFSARNVNVVVGFPPGGGYDTYARVFARHFGRHLPGNPGVVVQNQPGGGSLNLANATANTAPADGSHVALINSAAALEPVLGNPQAKFDTSRLVWIGKINSDPVSCAAWHKSGIMTWDDAVSRNGRFGGVGAAGTSSQHAYFLKNVLSAPITVITGYRGTNEINLAMQRGEVDVSCALFVSSVRGPYRQDYENGNLRVIIHSAGGATLTSRMPSTSTRFSRARTTAG